MPVVRAIFRYPIKGLTAQAVPGVELQAGKPFPFDRVFALARPGADIDPQAPRWAKKGRFLMLMLDEALARVQTHVDLATLHLTIRQPANESLSADLRTAEGRRSVELYFRQLLPELADSPRLVHAPDGHFMDKPDSVISCINLATLRSLEAAWGAPVDPLRFRANFYIDGADPWQEFDWVGGDIMLGDVPFKVESRNGRCAATNVNPVTGARDLDIPGALRAQFGHKDLGVYLVARGNGKVVIGDPVSVPEPSLPASRTEAPSPGLPPSGDGSFICRGCYYIHRERFASLPDDWRCPDCGTGKSNFRPCWPGLAPDARS